MTFLARLCCLTWNRTVGVVLTGLFLTGVVPAAHAIVRRDDVSESLYVSLAAEPQFAAVGSFGYCTGVLITPDWVLTAAHCVTGGLSPTLFNVGGTNYTADFSIAHPNWNGQLENGYDIGLVHLATPVVGVTPAQRYLGSDELGKSGVDVGFGYTGVGSTGYDGTGLGVKRASQNVADILGNQVPSPTPFRDDYLVADFDVPGDATATRLTAFGSSNSPMPLEGSIAPGDSGGGFFLQEGGVWKVAGVHSWIDGVLPGGDGSDNASYTDLFASTRVSVYNGWIDTQIGANSVVPEPGSAALVSCGLLAALALRRRRKLGRGSDQGAAAG